MTVTMKENFKKNKLVSQVGWCDCEKNNIFCPL